MAFVYHATRIIFLGTPYLYLFDPGGVSYSDWYEDIDYLVSLITHETIHIILAEKVDCYENDQGKWKNSRWFATEGWDKVCCEI